MTADDKELILIAIDNQVSAISDHIKKAKIEDRNNLRKVRDRYIELSNEFNTTTTQKEDD